MERNDELQKKARNGEMAIRASITKTEVETEPVQPVEKASPSRINVGVIPPALPTDDDGA